MLRFVLGCFSILKTPLCPPACGPSVGIGWPVISPPKTYAARTTRRSLAPQTRILLAPHDRFALILPDELLHFPANVRAPAIGKEPETEENFCRPGGVTSPHFSWPRARQTGRSQEAEWTLRPQVDSVSASD